MAQNQENLLLRGTRGTIANMITCRQLAGKTILSKKCRKNSCMGLQIRAEGIKDK
ncbi:MAG: hypothetical protein Q8918_13350 [Bacteroidota bacterium]|nr:hypothetical protein [Bacteroidota bacterium]